MSQKASAEMVESNFEKFAENAGWSLEDLADHLHDEYGSEDAEDGLMDGVTFEDEPEDAEDAEDAEPEPDNVSKVEAVDYGTLKSLASKAVERGIIAEYPGNGKEALKTALEGKVDQILNAEPEDAEDAEDAEPEPEPEDAEDAEDTTLNVPYGNTDDPNDPSTYDHPEAIMSRSEIKNHPNYDGSTDVNKLMHYQGKHGVCVECQVWAAMSGDKCNKCRKGSNGSSSNGPTVADIQETFGVNAEKARTAKKQYENGMFGSIKDAIDN